LELFYFVEKQKSRCLCTDYVPTFVPKIV
jgi:hypothetical protein